MEKPQLLIGRNDFVWGITGHNYGYAAYNENHLEEQIRLAAELGVDVYRLNLTPENDSDFAYMDRVVAYCEQYKLKLFLILFDRSFTDNYREPKDLYDTVLKISTRYRGRIPLYQISNEQDLHCLDLEKYKDPDGDLPHQYDPTRYANCRNGMLAICRAIKDGDPEAKTVINFAWTHFGILDMLLADGVTWDISAIDWYSDMDDAADINKVLDHLFAMPQEAVYIAEGNQIHGDFYKTEQQQADYLISVMNRMYCHPNPKMKGYMAYELLNEPALALGEAHYGIVLTDINGNIGRPKQAYIEISRLLNASKKAKI